MGLKSISKNINISVKDIRPCFSFWFERKQLIWLDDPKVFKGLWNIFGNIPNILNIFWFWSFHFFIIFYFLFLIWRNWSYCVWLLFGSFSTTFITVELKCLSRFFIKKWIHLLSHGFALRNFSFLESFWTGVCWSIKLVIWSQKSSKAVLAKTLFENIWPRNLGVLFRSR